MTTAIDQSASGRPSRFERSGSRSIIEDLIAYARAEDASDVNIGVDKTFIEVDGRLWDVGVPQSITADDMKGEIEIFLVETLSEIEMARIRGANGVADGATHTKSGNVRIHPYRCMEGVRVALRLLPAAIPEFEKLGLPKIVRTFATHFQSGIVLFTGKTGSGKSTSLNALLDIINREQHHHIYTLEDPIEFEHSQYPDSFISQTEVGRHVLSYSEGLRGILRAAPHVMMFAEMRDAESVKVALHASSSGHLVFSTLHTSEAMETVQRIVNYFPPEQHNNVRYQFAGALRAAVSQRLIPRRTGKGRVLACEVLINNPGIASLLADPEEIKQLRNTIHGERQAGMQLLEADLSRLVREGAISVENAKLATNHADELTLDREEATL